MSGRLRYKALNVEQAKQLLKAGHDITAADGMLYFPFSVMHNTCENMHTAEVSTRAFNHLRTRGLITLNEEKSRVKVGVFSCSGFAVWSPVVERLADDTR
jgi:hypothetical protein